MKLALVVPGGVDRSGEVRVIPALLALIARLAARHEVHVFALRQEPEPGRWPLRGAVVHNIGGGRGVSLRAVAAIRHEHRRAPFDVVQSIWAGACGTVAVAAARLLGRPSAVHIAGGELCALRDIGYGGRLTRRGRLREAFMLRAADAVSAASAPVLAQCAALGCTARRIALGVDLAAWPQRAPRRRDAGAPLRLIHVASLNAVKDHATLLEALARAAALGVAFELDVVGEDVLGGLVRAQARAERLGLAPHVRFHGFLTQAQLRPLVERADLNAVTSRHEAGPLVVLEAAALGVPSVGTAVGHLAEWAPEAALAVPVGASAALAEAIAALATDEDRRLRIAAAAQQRALADDADRTAALFEALHAELVHGRQGSGRYASARRTE